MELFGAEGDDEREDEEHDDEQPGEDPELSPFGMKADEK